MEINLFKSRKAIKDQPGYLPFDTLTAGRKLWNWWAPQIIGNVRIMAYRNIFFIISIMLQRKCFFSVYRLAVDAKPDRVMVLQAENIWACSRISRRLRHPGLVRDLHQAQGVYLGFCESLLPQTVQAEDVIFNDNRVILRIITNNLCLSVGSVGQECFVSVRKLGH